MSTTEQQSFDLDSPIWNLVLEGLLSKGKTETEAWLMKSLRRKKQQKRTGKPRDMVSPFRNRIWDLFEKEAKGMDGADVVLALRQAGEEIWAVGIDDVYSAMPNQDDEALGNAFDITWLTVVCIKLREIKSGHRPQLRLRVTRGSKSKT